MSQYENPPAFPSRESTVLYRADGTEQTTMVDKGERGLSLRDYFAAKAMLGLIEGYEFEAREKSVVKTDRTGFDDHPHPEDSDATYASQLAGEAYIIADAMLKARGQ